MPNNIPRPEEVLGKSNKIPPPSEVLGKPIKKKESTSKDSHFYTEAVKEAGLPVTGQKKEQKPSVSSTTKDSKPDGVYTFEGRKEAVYKKKGNDWYIDPNNSGSFQKIPSNRTDRISILEKQAKRVYNSGVDEQEFEWETEQSKPVDVKIENKDNDWYSKAINSIPTNNIDTEKVNIEQKHFNKNFEAKESDDPEVIAKNKKDDYIKSQLSLIDGELVGSSEEEVVPKLNAIIKTLGEDSDSFEVNQAGFGYDAIEIKNKLTGQKMFINLDNWSDGRDVEESKALKAFLDVNTKFSSLNKMIYQREQLRKRAIDANPMDKAEIEKQISDLNNEIRNQEAAKRNYASSDKYLAAAVYDKAAVNNIKVGYQEAQIKSIDLKKEFDEFSKWKNEVDLAVKDGRISQEEFELNYKPKLENDFNSIQKKALAISEDFDAMKEEASSMDVVAGLNYAYQENRGNVLTNATSSFMSGAAGVFEFAGDLTVNADKQPGWKMGFDPNTSESWTEWISPQTISKEYLTSDERSAFEMVIGGLSNSIGSSTAGKLLMPGATNVGSYFGLFASSYENMRNQFDTPELKDVPEYEKILMSSLYGASVGLLEKYGLSKAMSKSPVSKKYINYILANTLKNIPKDASAEVIEAEINTTIKGMISKGMINIGGASLVEGTTEASQEMADIGLKTIYNEAKGKDFFNTPKTGGELMSRLGENFALGMLGGAGMNSVSQAVSIPRQSMTISDLNKIENTITNSNLKDIFKLDIKTKVANGEITKAQGIEKLENLRRAEATLNLIPNNVSPENKYTAFKLISEKETLQTEIQGKDEALVSAQKERINAINEELKTISQNATKENNVEQQEGAAEGSTVEYQGADEGQQKVGQGEGSQRETSQPEADNSDSTVTSEVQQKEIDAKQAEVHDIQIESVKKYAELQSKGLTNDEIQINPEFISIRDRESVAQSELDVLNKSKDNSDSTVEVTPAFKETEDVNLYSQSLESARAEMKKAGKGDDLQVSPVSPEEAQSIIDEGGKIFISEDGKYGGYVKADGYMGGLFKDPNMKYKGVSKLLQDARVKEGGRFMEGFATYLEKEYVKNGFRPVARLKFNEEYAPEGWDAPNSSLRTKPDVVFFAYDPTGKYEVGEGEYFDDYDQAYEAAKNYGIDTKAANAESIEQMLQSEEYADVDTKLLKAARLVSKALPKTKIYLHKTTDAYNAGIARAAGMTKEQVANEEGQSSGEYVNGEIHINLEIADATTVFHEAFHDIFSKKAFTSGAAIDMANGLRKIVSDKALIKRLDDFISNYESAEQSEEFLAELTGIITDAEVELTTTKLHAFKQLINKIAQKLGLPAIFGATASRQDVLDFINTMSRKLRTGEKIDAEFSDNPLEVVRKQKVFGSKKTKIEVIYAEQDRIQELIDKGLLAQTDDISDFNGMFAATTSPDDMLVGEILINGESKAEGNGGVFFVTKFGDVWASSNGSVADQIANRINKSRAKNNGKGYLLLTKGSDAKLISSPQGASSSLKIVEALVSDGLVSASDFRKAVNAAIKSNPQTKASIDISGTMSSTDMISAVDSLFDDVKKSSFDNRGTILRSIIIELGKTESISKNNSKIVEFLGGDTGKSLGWSKTSKSTKTSQSAIDLIAGISREDLTKGVDSGAIYAVIEVDDDVMVSKDKHASYPFHIKQKNGKQPKLILLRNRLHGREVMMSENNEGYDVLGASFDGKILGTASNGYGEGYINYNKDRKKRISPENSSNYANLTEDGKGNFVFYHVGGNDFKTIKRGSGGTLATSKGEANAIGKVGGIAQYYTRPEDGESMVSGPSKYIVKVDQGKVYDFNTDPDNLFDQAKERFESEYPGAAFDANTQLAYVTKIANEQGYDMVVADWNGRTRAQTTNEFAPDDVQVSEGNTIIKPFKENYISNTANGYESVIPESKISKLEKLFDKIYKVRNAESKYDALYSLGQDYGKMSTEEISSLILNSDLSEDIKNEYNDIMSYEPGVRSSRKKRKAPTVEQQIAKAVRDSKMDFKNKQRAIASLVRDMQKSGKINAKQAAIIVERFSKLNVDNPVTVDRYLKYVEKVMNDADYDQKLKNARSLRSKIKRFKNAQATVVAMGKKFTSIDPSMIDDFESYMEIGDKVYNALKPTRSNGGDPSYRMATVIGEINEYSDKVLSDIEEKVKNDLLETYKGLVDAGIINSEMTLKELQAEIKKMDENPEHVTDYDADIREINKEMFKSLSETIEMDQFTPEEQKLIKEFMAMDIEKMNVRDGYAAVEAMDNLRLNGILDGIQAMVYQYKGYTNAAELKSKVKTRDLRLYFSKGIGRFVSNQSANLKVLADTIFIGVKSGGEVLAKMGVSAFETGIARASKIFRSEVDSYGNDFHKTRPNGESFHTARNAFERGFYATLKRTVIGSESEQKAEFKRKVGLIKESIKTLSEGSKDEKKKSALYQEIYEKLGLDKAESILDVETKVDKINRDAVDHVINMWSKYYQQLSDVSLSVYNTMLKADLNYTTDKFARLTRNVISAQEAERMISKNGSFASAVGFTDKSKSGVLIESTKPNLTPGRYIDLNFDMNNFTALKAALIDINTAGPVRQIEAFLKSKDYQSMISSAEDLALFTKRVNNYITRAKGKEMIDNDSWRDAERMLNVLATFGTSKALGSVMQPFKQVIPVALNTMLNSRTADLNIIKSMDKDFNEWYNNNGISTSNRGAEATSAIESADKYLDSIPDSKLGKVAEHASRLNEFWIKKFLANPDVFIARASWLTYYKQSLKEQGIDTKDIDWTTHEKNEKAADYAVHQVDRQQGVSDTAMAGELFASKNSLSKIVKNTVFPFATFSMNQKQRMYSDIRTYVDKNATSEDKKIALRSASALTIEMLAYQAIGWTIRYYLYKTIAEAITGVEPDDEDEERDWKFALQYTISNTVKDFFSIAPPLDGVTLKGFDAAMSGLQNLADYGGMEANEAVKAENLKREENGEEKMTPEEEKKFRDELFNDNRWRFEDFDNGMLNAGTYTILYQKAVENYNLEEMARTGKVLEENEYGTKEKFLLPEDVSKLRAMLALDGAFILGFLPADSHSISKNVQKIIKRRALTEVQMEKYKEIKKEYGNVPDYVLGIIKDTRKEVPKIVEEIEWIKREGGLTKAQEKKYMSIMKKNGEVTSDDLRKIKSGS